MRVGAQVTSFFVAIHDQAIDAVCGKEIERLGDQGCILRSHTEEIRVEISKFGFGYAVDPQRGH